MLTTDDPMVPWLRGLGYSALSLPAGVTHPAAPSGTSRPTKNGTPGSSRQSLPGPKRGGLLGAWRLDAARNSSPKAALPRAQHPSPLGGGGGGGGGVGGGV